MNNITDCWEEGYTDNLNGRVISDVPYKNNTLDATEWYLGFYSAANDRNVKTQLTNEPAYKAGRNDFCHNKSLQDNPYPPDSIEYCHWEYGFKITGLYTDKLEVIKVLAHKK